MVFRHKFREGVCIYAGVFLLSFFRHVFRNKGYEYSVDIN